MGYNGIAGIALDIPARPASLQLMVRDVGDTISKPIYMDNPPSDTFMIGNGQGPAHAFELVRTGAYVGQGQPFGEMRGNRSEYVPAVKGGAGLWHEPCGRLVK